MRLSLIILCVILSSCAHAQKKNQENFAQDIIAIKKVMEEQQKAWSRHDLEGFMQGYWANDSLKFYGQSGLTKGWHQTLANYKKSYPKPEDTGVLNFDLLDISQITPGAYWVMGRYHLKRSVGDAQGSFLVIFKNMEGSWKIVADMSASDQ